MAGYCCVLLSAIAELGFLKKLRRESLRHSIRPMVRPRGDMAEPVWGLRSRSDWLKCSVGILESKARQARVQLSGSPPLLESSRKMKLKAKHASQPWKECACL